MDIPNKYPAACLIGGNMFSKEDGMQATGVPSSVKHALEMIEIKKVLASQQSEMLNLQELVKNTDAGKLDSFLDDIKSHVSASLSNQMFNIATLFDNNTNSSVFLSLASSSSLTVASSDIVPASILISAPSPVNATVSNPTASSSIENNIMSKMAFDKAMTKDIAEWKTGKELFHWGGKFHLISSPYILTGLFFYVFNFFY